MGQYKKNSSSFDRRVKNLPKEPEQVLSESWLRALISYAIKNNIRFDFFYSGEDDTVLEGYRNVSPVAVGNHITTGRLVFRAQLNEGVSKSKKQPNWRLFRIDRVKTIRIHYKPQRSRFNKLYSPNDKHIGDLHTQSYRRKDNKRTTT